MVKPPSRLAATLDAVKLTDRARMDTDEMRTGG